MSRMELWYATTSSPDDRKRRLESYFTPMSSNVRAITKRWRKNSASKETKLLYIRGDVSTPTVLEEVYALSIGGDLEGALDKILDTLDEFVSAGTLAQCDKLLQLVDLNKLAIPLVLAFLSGTYIVRTKLAARPAFYEAAYQRVAREKPEDVDRLVVRFQ